MFFLSLNDGRKVNLLFISKIYVQESDVIYETAKGSLDNIVEHFDSETEANSRYEELKQTYEI